MTKLLCFFALFGACTAAHAEDYQVRGNNQPNTQQEALCPCGCGCVAPCHCGCTNGKPCTCHQR